MVDSARCGYWLFVRCLRRQSTFSQLVAARATGLNGILAKRHCLQIFAINTIVPVLSIVYWQGDFPTRYQFGLNAGTLIGSMIGQLAFGILADRYGRRKMYGLELVVTIGASLGFATASSGVNNSMSLIAFLIFWRTVSV